MKLKPKWKHMLLRALRAAMATGRNGPELITAQQAVKNSSPIALQRASRALCNALAAGGEEQLMDLELRLCRAAIAAIADLEADRNPDVSAFLADDEIGPPPGRPPEAGEAASAHIHMRTTPARKNHYVRHARASGLTLAEWITGELDRASGFPRPSRGWPGAQHE